LRTTFVQTLAEIAEDNPNLWLLCGDLGYSVLEHFATRFPARYLNVGVAEQNLAGIAAGLALTGKTVFIYSIGNFPTLRCLEQLRNDVCYHGADVKVVSVGAGFAYGSQGYTHHAIEDVAVMSVLPGMEVFVPCDPSEVSVATRMIAASGNPSYLRLSRSGEPVLHSARPADLRRPAILQEGRDLVLLASGPIASACLQAAEALACDSIQAAVVSVPCVKPLDEGFIRELAARNCPILTVEEHILRGGLFAGVAACLADRPRHHAIAGIGIPEPTRQPLRGGDREALLAESGLTAGAIADRARHVLHG
jgi:transketolase